SAYAVAKAQGMIKLDAMENPYGLPPAVRASIGAATGAVALNRYPDGAADALKDALRRALRLPERAALMLGNGSDELIQIVTSAVATPGARIVAPDPTFVMYRHNALLAHAHYVPVPLRADLALD